MDKWWHNLMGLMQYNWEGYNQSSMVAKLTHIHTYLNPRLYYNVSIIATRLVIYPKW